MSWRFSSVVSGLAADIQFDEGKLKILFFPYMRRLLMQPPIAENMLPGCPESRARFARREAVEDP
jgi:hypothetical protein